MIPRLLVLVLVLGISACARQPISIERAANLDFALGDECSYSVIRRPDDCYDRPPCMWSDANLRVTFERGAYQLDASSGAWDGGPRPPVRLRFNASASTPDGLARQLPRVLEAFDGSLNATRACVYINPDQSLLFGDVMAFHDALVAQGVRRVGFYAALAESDVRN